MISDINTARQVSELMLDVSGRLDESVATVSKNCPSEEFVAYRTAVGRILGEILLDVLNPLYAKHPVLKPRGLE